jgi:phosphoribosylformimino-5-aminoimidazole carboxamide ribotide isomerase
MWHIAFFAKSLSPIVNGLDSMQIWPAIDLRGGKCVRLQQGDYNRETVFGEDPPEMAKHWVDLGAECLHLVDLDGARDGSPANREAVDAILAAVDIPCELGGGIRDERTVRGWLDAGLSRLVIGTKALREPDWFREMCQRYPGKLALGLDARDGRVATDGWLETSDVNATDMVKQFADESVAAIIYTDIAKDGMMSGPNFKAIADMQGSTGFPVIASGGVTTIDDVRRLAELDVAGCIIGRTLYEGKMTIAEAIDAARTNRAKG